LRDDDVDKIVATYRQRLQEDKYSYCAPLSEVAENDFNLNIPRYVDTFEEEEEIDLAAIALELRSMDREMEENDRVIRGFCEELGIDAPF
jgi:type I restriction enzyme M protein